MGARPAERVKVAGLDDCHQLSRKPDGACIYLGPENQCRIHQHFGPEAMPLMCRLYPFGFYAMGERTAVDVSFYCRSVGQGSGAPIGESIADYARLLPARDSADTRRHRLRDQVPLDGSTMWEIEHHMLSLLADGSLTPVDRIRCVLQFVRLATTGHPAQPTVALLRKAMAKGIPTQIRDAPLEATMDRTQQAVFYQWLYLAFNPAPRKFHRLVPAEQAAVQNQRETAGRRFRDRHGRPTVDGVELGVDFERIALVETGIFVSGDCRPGQDFLCAKIIGQKFLVAGQKELPLVEATLKFLLCFPMAVWTSKALAADRGAAAVEEPDLRQAIRLIDRTLGRSRRRSCHASNGTSTTGSCWRPTSLRRRPMTSWSADGADRVWRRPRGQLENAQQWPVTIPRIEELRAFLCDLLRGRRGIIAAVLFGAGRTARRHTEWR